ncbi:MAG: aromatic amino acid lyase, partial [Rhodothermales bacterium]|nr:aromatic amino acid lyase [Rhodothermales bacterium]
MIRVRVAHLHEDLDASLAELRANPESVIRAREIVNSALSDGSAYYGINTGFGVLARQQIPADQLETLQKNLLLSHAVGVGDWVPFPISRLML